jgi:phage terminase large subunit GpA-like protein
VPENLRLAPSLAAKPGPIDLARFPWWKEPLACVDDINVEEIVLISPTQIGKTTVLFSIALAEGHLRPSPMLIVGPDRDFMRPVRDTLYEMAEESPALRDSVPPPRLRNRHWVDLGGARVYLGYCGNTQSISGKPCRVVLQTEVDRYRHKKAEGATHKIAGERTKAFFRSLILYEGTIIGVESTLMSLYEESDQRRYLCPCPRCGHYQEIRFFPHREGPFAGRGGVVGIKGSDGAWLTPHAAREHAYYVCEQGCQLDDAHINHMARLGRWVPKGQRIERGKLIGTPDRPPTRAGFGGLVSLVSDTITIGRMAQEYLEARRDPELLKNFMHNWVGIAYRPSHRVPKWHALGRKLSSTYPLGKVPDWAIFLTGAADKQADRAYWSVRGWGEKKRSALVDFGEVACERSQHGELRVGSDLPQLDGYALDCSFDLVAPNRYGQRQLRVRLFGVDTQHDPHTVWDWIRKHQGDRVRALGGDANPLYPFYRMQVVEKSARDGKPYEGGMTRWGINTANYKQGLLDRWALEPGDDGFCYFPADAVDCCASYLAQMTNEAPVATDKGIEWQIIDRSIGNHAFDLEVYHTVLADMVVGLDWTRVAALFVPNEQAAAKEKEQAGGGIIRRPAGRGLIRR